MKSSKCSYLAKFFQSNIKMTTHSQSVDDYAHAVVYLGRVPTQAREGERGLWSHEPCSTSIGGKSRLHTDTRANTRNFSADACESVHGLLKYNLLCLINWKIKIAATANQFKLPLTVVNDAWLPAPVKGRGCSRRVLLFGHVHQGSNRWFERPAGRRAIYKITIEEGIWEFRMPWSENGTLVHLHPDKQYIDNAILNYCCDIFICT